jgi:competence protein ComEC
LRLRGGSLTVVVGGLLWTGWLVLWPGGTGPGYAVHVLSVGSGDATLVTAPNRHALLVDVGTLANSDVGETAAAAIRELGVRTMDGIAISHANFDHYSGLPTLLLTTQVKQILVNPYFEQAAAERSSVQALARALPSDAPPRAVIRSGDHLSLHDGEFEVLWPPAGLDGTWKINDRSLVLRFSVHGRRVMIPGDIERDAIRALLTAHAERRIDLRADVLIAPHHGSVIAGDTAAFYAAVSPQAIIVSTARERRRLAVLVRETLGPDCRLISTRDVGAVTVRVTPDAELAIETPYAQTPH